MNIENIKTFLSIVEHRSISGAARALFISQPAVSSQLNYLEKSLGVQLIQRNRGTKAALLTKDGNAFMPLAQEWLQLAERTEEFKWLHQPSKKQQYIRIGISVSGYEYIFSEIIHQLMQEYPSLDLQIKIIARENALNALLSQETDAVIVMGAQGNVPHHPLIDSIPILREERCILCPKNTLLPEGCITPELLDPNYEVVFSRNATDLTEWRNMHFPAGVNPYAENDNIMTCYCYLTNPRCWTICPCSVAMGLVSAHPERLTYRSIAPAIPLRTCDLLVPKKTNQSSTISKLIQATMHYTNTAPYLHPIKRNTL